MFTPIVMTQQGTTAGFVIRSVDGVILWSTSSRRQVGHCSWSKAIAQELCTTPSCTNVEMIKTSLPVFCSNPQSKGENRTVFMDQITKTFS